MAIVVDSSTAPSKDEEEATASSPAAPKPAVDLKDSVRAVARKFAEEQVQITDADVWGVLTAVSGVARRRPQGMNILLSADEHCLGRCVEDTRFQIGSQAISSNHCKISRERLVAKDGNSGSDPIQSFLKDTSTNGTFLNWQKIKKNNPKVKIQHGDLISFIAPPHDDKSFAFVYREVRKKVCLGKGANLKRKSEEFVAEGKRLKGIGIGAPDGPISLDDVRSLQRSNTELRQQLESHILTIETLHSESRECISRHETVLKEQKETISSCYLAEIKELKTALDVRQNQLNEVHTLSADLRSSVKDLNERLKASLQSRVDADEIINSQKATISDLDAQLTEERNLRRREHDKAETVMKSALQRAHSEAQTELKRQADIHLRQQREQQEVVNKLQESEKESRLLVEALRSKLEDARERLVISDKKVRQLEVQLQDEQTTCVRSKERSETLETELRKLRKELESEKQVAREEAWAKVSTLELEIEVAIRDLSIEKQRFQGARERIILRETQLRAFYTTTEEISALFVKQQEQLKAMQRTLEDEENYESTSLGINLNEPAIENVNAVYVRAREYGNRSNKRRGVSGASTPEHNSSGGAGGDDGDDDITVTDKHECGTGRDDNTQDLECTSADRTMKRFDSDIDGVYKLVPDADTTDTEHVPATESPVGAFVCNQPNHVLHKCSNETGDTMQLDVETQPLENLEHTANPEDKSGQCSPSRMEDSGTGTIRTADLLASEVAGSWAVSTAPSAYGENESPRSMDPDVVAVNEEEAAAALLLCSNSDSQSNAACSGAKLNEKPHALNATINIAAPELKQQFQGSAGCEKGCLGDLMSDAETEDGGNSLDGSLDGSYDGAEDEVEDSVG